MKKRQKGILLLLLIGSLCMGGLGCSMKMPKNGMIGFKEKRMNDRRFIISYTDKDTFSWKLLHYYIKKECQKIQKREKFSYFEVINQKEELLQWDELQNFPLETSYPVQGYNQMVVTATNIPVNYSRQLKRVTYDVVMYNRIDKIF